MLARACEYKRLLTSDKYQKLILSRLQAGVNVFCDVMTIGIVVCSVFICLLFSDSLIKMDVESLIAAVYKHVDKCDQQSFFLCAFKKSKRFHYKYFLFALALIASKRSLCAYPRSIAFYLLILIHASSSYILGGQRPGIE